MTTPGHEQERTGARAPGRRDAVRVTVPRRGVAEPGAANPDLVRAALAGLTHDDQRLLWLKYVDQAGDLTVARLLGVAASTVPWRLRAAERRLSAGLAAVLARAAAGVDDACADTLASLGAYVQHRLTGNARGVVESHLFACQDCMRAFTDVRQARWALRDAAPLLLAGGAGLSAAGVPVVLGAGAAGGAGGVLAALGGGAGLGSALAALRGAAETVRGVVPSASGASWALGSASTGVVLVTGVAATVMLSADTRPAPGVPEVASVVAAQSEVRAPLVPVEGAAASSAPVVPSPTPTSVEMPPPEAAVPGLTQPVGESSEPTTTGEPDVGPLSSQPPSGAPESPTTTGEPLPVDEVTPPPTAPDGSAPTDPAAIPSPEPGESLPTESVETVVPGVVYPWPVPPPVWGPPFWGPPPPPVWGPPVGGPPVGGPEVPAPVAPDPAEVPHVEQAHAHKPHAQPIDTPARHAHPGVDTPAPHAHPGVDTPAPHAHPGPGRNPDARAARPAETKPAWKEAEHSG